MGIIERTYRLTNEPGGLGLKCNSTGLSLAGVPLLQKSETGFVLRPHNEIEALVKAAYGAGAMSSQLLGGLSSVARALNNGDLALAMTAAVLTRLSELDWDSAARIAKADRQLWKYNPEEARDWHGCWTDDDGADASGQDKLPQTPVDSAPAAGGKVPDEQPSPPANDISANEDEEPVDNRPSLERKYDDLGPVDFAKQVIEFADQLGRQSEELTPEERDAARAEYDFIQSRLSFWLGHDNKPVEAQNNLISASLTLFQGAQLSGITSVKEIPQSMGPVAVGAMALDGAQPGLPAGNPSAGSFLDGEYVPYVGEFVPYRLGGVVNNDEMEWGGGIKEQGNPWEIGVQQEFATTTKLAPGSKTFDHFGQISGEAVSDKTLNTLTYSRITNPQSIYGTLKRYVDAAADYTPRASIDVDPSRIRTKRIQLAVPEYTSPEQWVHINRAVQYGRQRGVSVMVTRIRSGSGRN